MSARLLGAKQRFNKERFQLEENLGSARCSPFVIVKVLAARIRKLITARARKNKGTARMLANACKDHSIPLNRLLYAAWLTNLPRFQGARPDHVRVESSCCCFPRELVSFVRPRSPRELVSFVRPRELTDDSRRFSSNRKTYLSLEL